MSLLLACEGGGPGGGTSTGGNGAENVPCVCGARGGGPRDGIAGGIGDGVATFRACRTARWYLDMATDNWSFVSISVRRVSSSGGGLSEFM